jgi:chemotaxis protein MotB
MRRVLLVVGAAAVVACGGISKEQYSAKEAEATKYKQAAQDESGKVSALESKVSSLEQQNSTLQGQTEDLQKKLTATSATSAAAQSEIQARTPLRLNERLLFKENSSKLTPEGKRALDSMAQAIAPELKDKSILVAGYADNAEGGGKDAKTRRWQLSSARAIEVAKYLAGRGIEPMHIAVAGFGEARPIAPNDTLANKALNRRAEISLMPSSSMKPGTLEVKPAELGPKK